MEVKFPTPTQVKFKDVETDEIHYGIAYGNEVICGCCGGIFEIDEDAVIGEVLPWVPIEEVIR